MRSAELEARPALLKEIDAGLHYYDTLRHRVSTLVAAHLLAVAESTQQGPRAARLSPRFPGGVFPRSSGG